MNHPSFGTRVRRSDEVGVQRIEGPEDRIFLQSGITMFEIPMRR
jgi:hypothetical protein